MSSFMDKVNAIGDDLDAEGDKLLDAGGALEEQKKEMMRRILTQAFFCGVFGFFAFGYTDEPTSLSVSNDDDLLKNIPFLEEDGSATSDVGMRFHLFFQAQFWLNALVLACLFANILGLLLCISRPRIVRNVKKVTLHVLELTQYIMLALWLAIVVVRFQPSGKEASGDNLAFEADKSNTVFYEGLFLWWSVIIIGFLIVFNYFAGH